MQNKNIVLVLIAAALLMSGTIFWLWKGRSYESKTPPYLPGTTIPSPGIFQTGNPGS